MDQLLDKIEQMNKIIVEVDVLKERRLDVAVYVGSVEGLSNTEIVHLNDSFESTFQEKTNWIIRSRDLADKEIAVVTTHSMYALIGVSVFFVTSDIGELILVTTTAIRGKESFIVMLLRM